MSGWAPARGEPEYTSAKAELRYPKRAEAHVRPQAHRTPGSRDSSMTGIAVVCGGSKPLIFLLHWLVFPAAYTLGAGTLLLHAGGVGLYR